MPYTSENNKNHSKIDGTITKLFRNLIKKRKEVPNKETSITRSYFNKIIPTPNKLDTNQ